VCVRGCVCVCVCVCVCLLVSDYCLLSCLRLFFWHDYITWDLPWGDVCTRVCVYSLCMQHRRSLCIVWLSVYIWPRNIQQSLMASLGHNQKFRICNLQIITLLLSSDRESLLCVCVCVCFVFSHLCFPFVLFMYLFVHEFGFLYVIVLFHLLTISLSPVFIELVLKIFLISLTFLFLQVHSCCSFTQRRRIFLDDLWKINQIIGYYRLRKWALNCWFKICFHVFHGSLSVWQC